MVATDFHGVEKINTIEANGYCQLFGYQHTSEYILCSAEEKIIIQVGTT